MKYVIDAQNKKLGRVAQEAATLLMGKNTPEFAKNIVPDVTVEIINTSKADINARRKADKYYKNYSGFPGGQRIRTMEKVIEDKGYSEVFRLAVKGMLPDNKLKAKMMANLVVTE